MLQYLERGEYTINMLAKGCDVFHWTIELHLKDLIDTGNARPTRYKLCKLTGEEAKKAIDFLKSAN